ncbi:hypothetical protein C8J57DRAFT_1472280 [Mycena rebaudengoi]|nr:hypothetical protein C8J57DRAFT_1472280 [Mycena rebaudengoi]
MTFRIHYPNDLMGSDYIRRYDDYFESLPKPPATVQFPSNFSIVHPERAVYYAHGHRSPTSVPSLTSPSPTFSDFVYASSPTDSELSSSSEEIDSSNSIYESPPSLPATPPPSPTSPSTQPSVLAPSNLALVPTFSEDNGFVALETVLGDPTLRFFTRITLETGLLTHTPLATDVVQGLDMGQTYFVLAPIMRDLIAKSLNGVADFIHCAANDHNPFFDGGRPDIPPLIYRCTLDQLCLSIPGISIHSTYQLNPPGRITRFSTEEDVHEYVKLAKAVYHYYINWIANAIRISTGFGYHCSFNWGAPLGMSKTEFIHRVTRYFSYGGYTSLEQFMGHQLHRNAMDFACSRLLSNDPNLRIISFTRGERTFLVRWPIPYYTHEMGDVFVGIYLRERSYTLAGLDAFVINHEP